ncbi:hypothetical protein CRG98_048975, partial [Punica granatum]
MEWAVWVNGKAGISLSVVVVAVQPKTEEEMSLLGVAEAPCFPGVVIQGQEEVALLNVEGEIWQSE